MKWLITGGAGFIGCNAAKRLLNGPNDVIVVDNLTRPGSLQNLEWLKTQGKFDFLHGDIRNFDFLTRIFHEVRDIDVVLHLAAQVAVTDSVVNPREDFEVNLLGTLNVCEAIRLLSPDTILLNASTNKVYGKMKDVQVTLKDKRYACPDFPFGISEEHPVDFHSPYGCSKGGAEQYVRDYHRIYGLKTLSFRQSCVYGTRQFGVEDQGWVAWFMIAAITGKPLTIFGDGKQVRDALWVGDLIDCYQNGVETIQENSGRIYNVGGGPENTLSILELVSFIEEHLNQKVLYTFGDWRPGDQPVYISDIRKAQKELRWSPRTPKSQGLLSLFQWIRQEKRLFGEPAFSL